MAVQHHQYDDEEISHSEESSPFIIDLVPELQRRIKRAAAENGLSVQEYLERLLDQTVPPEETSTQRRPRHLSRQAIEDLKRFREEIKQAHPGQVFEDSAELIRQAREERMRELEQQ